MKASKIIIFIIFPCLIFFNSGCGGCSKSGLKHRSSSNAKSTNESNIKLPKGKTIVPMETSSGVRYVYIEINGLKLRFIFDTGASNICISIAEAIVLLRQGTLLEEDIIDVQYFRDATGRVSAGTRINLRTVKIGDRVLKNVEAIVIEGNEAPLLLGQSALEQFGRISIDNRNNVIIFEE